MDVRNVELRTSTRLLVEASLLLLRSLVEKGETVPRRVVEAHRITGPASWSIDYEPRPEWSAFVRRHEHEITALPEFDAWLRAMQGDTMISKHLESFAGTSQGGVRRIPWDYLTHMLTRQLSEGAGDLAMDLPILDRTYRDLERFFYHPQVEFRAFSPLQNFSADVDTIHLGNGLRIRRIVDRELEQLLDATTFSSMIPFGEIPSYRFAMEVEYETDKIFGEWTLTNFKPSPDLELFPRLLTALRLFKAGAVGSNVIQTLPVADTPAVFGAMRGGLGYRRFWGPAYSLTGPEVGEFVDFWSRFGEVNLSQPGPLGIAISRFNYAYERMGLEDRLIDYMIAFEALVFKTGDVGENRHKLSVRVARLLSNNYEDRRRIAKEVADFYNSRNQVVHGERARLKVEFIEQIERYLRESIKYFLRLPPAAEYDDVISRLDLG